MIVAEGMKETLPGQSGRAIAHVAKHEVAIERHFRRSPFTFGGYLLLDSC